MIKELKIIEEFEAASRSKHGSYAYASGYFSVMLAEAIARLPEHVQKVMIQDIQEKTIEFQSV
jgi:hypothetical protein